jgi:predicted Fe-Mo cluster-binding NifX family protein
MRIAVASQGAELGSKVDPRFGRAAYFVIYDTESEEIEAVANEQNVFAEQGAGVQAAQTVASRNVDLVVAGNFGPKAFKALTAAGAKVALWTDGTVREAVELAHNNMLAVSNEANVEGHWM